MNRVKQQSLFNKYYNNLFDIQPVHMEEEKKKALATFSGTYHIQ